MQLPSITSAYHGILGLLYLVLGLQVSRLRRESKLSTTTATSVRGAILTLF